MSTPDLSSDATPHSRGSRIWQFARALAVLVVLATAARLCVDERATITSDLQLLAEPVAQPFAVLALRAFLLADVDAPQGPHLASATVAVRLLDAQRRELAHGQLKPSRRFGSEGRLGLPGVAAGHYQLEARVLGDSRLGNVCVRDLWLREGSGSERAQGRMASPLAQYALGALVELEAGERPSQLLPRVVGGSCVAEQSCRLWVWMGEPAARLGARSSAAVEVLAIEPREPTAGLVRLDVRVRGLEAQLTLEAARDGRLVARRELRLPVATGEPRLSLTRSLLHEGEALTVSLVPPPGRSALILDAFHEGRWTSTESVEPSAAELMTRSFAPDAVGLWRLQAHADPFSADSAATGLFYVGDRAVPERQLLLDLAQRLVNADPGDEVARLTLKNGLPSATAPDAWASFLLAPKELLRVALPEATSNRPVLLAQLARRQHTFRWGVGAVMSLMAVAAFVSLLRHGLAARRRASALLREADPNVAVSARVELLERVGVLLWSLSVLIAFGLGALLVVARSLWF